MASEVTRHKPIIAIKSGTHERRLEGRLVAHGHAWPALRPPTMPPSSSRASSAPSSVQDLFDIAQAFARQPLLKGENIGVITNAGGPGIMASDAIEHAGLRLASLTNETKQALQAKLPPAASVANPVDVLGDALRRPLRDGDRHVLADPNVDALMVVLTPQTMTQIPETARGPGHDLQEVRQAGLRRLHGRCGDRARACEVLRSHNVPNYQVPERAVKAIAAMRDYRTWLNTPPLAVETFNVNRGKVAELLARTRADGRVTMGDAEAREVLEAYGIPLPKSGIAETPMTPCAWPRRSATRS